MHKHLQSLLFGKGSSIDIYIDPANPLAVDGLPLATCTILFPMCIDRYHWFCCFKLFAYMKGDPGHMYMVVLQCESVLKIDIHSPETAGIWCQPKDWCVMHYKHIAHPKPWMTLQPSYPRYVKTWP